MGWIRSRTAVVALVAVVAALTICLGTWQGWLAQAADDTWIVNDDLLPAEGGCNTPDFETDNIDAVIDHVDVSDGDTLVICEGTYQGGVTVDKSLTIEGRADANRADIVVRGGGGSDGFIVTADGVTIRHIRFDGVDDSGTGVNVTGDNATIEHVEAVNWVTGIRLVGSSDSVVEHCEADDNGAAISVRYSANNVIRGNVAGADNGWGLTIHSGDLTLVEDNHLSGISGALYLVREPGPPLHVRVVRNTIHASSDGILIERIPSADSLIVIGGRPEDANTFEGSPNTAAGDFFLEMKCGAGPPDSEVTVNATWNYWGGSTARSAIAALIYDDEDDNECGTPHGAVVFHPWATEPAPTPSPSPTPTPTPSPTPSPTPVADTRDFDLQLGWNNFVWTGADATAADTALNCIAGDFAIAYGLDAGGWLRYVPGDPDITTLATVDKYDNLLVLVTASGVQCLGMPVGP